ncbi:MAG: serine/threonine-protein phosphatase [Lachnospiraceae bacterium]|nr:serine/threonine-protein phosphatase [Lachnospiraceae bacterium]
MNGFWGNIKEKLFLKHGIDAIFRTDIGCIPCNNEDNLFFNGYYKADLMQASDEGHGFYKGVSLFAVCDGMGGEDFGEEASNIAVANLKIFGLKDIQKDSLNNLIEINKLIDYKRMEHGCTNMGTTMAGLYIEKGKAIACNIGDSRIYLYRDNVLKQLTEDHTEAQYFASIGFESDGKNGRKKGGNALTQYLGMPVDEVIIEPYYSEIINLKRKDRFLICSDGVTDMVDDEQLKYLLSMQTDIGHISEMIMETAMKAGGKDNITEILIEVK